MREREKVEKNLNAIHNFCLSAKVKAISGTIYLEPNRFQM